VEWGCARADSEGRKNEVTKLKEKKKSVITVNSKSPLRGGDRSWGEDSFLSPNRSGARAPALRREMRGNSTAPSNLGASSPSGNARGRMSEGESFSPAKLASNARDNKIRMAQIPPNEPLPLKVTSSHRTQHNGIEFRQFPP